MLIQTVSTFGSRGMRGKKCWKSTICAYIHGAKVPKSVSSCSELIDALIPRPHPFKSTLVTSQHPLFNIFPQKSNFRDDIIQRVLTYEYIQPIGTCNSIQPSILPHLYYFMDKIIYKLFLVFRKTIFFIFPCNIYFKFKLKCFFSLLFFKKRWFLYEYKRVR